MQVFSPCVSPRVEKKWPFLSPHAARVDRQSQGRSLRVFQIVVLYDELLPIVVLVSPASAKGDGERREESCVDVILDDKKSHNYSTATLRRRYLRSKCGTHLYNSPISEYIRNVREYIIARCANKHEKNKKNICQQKSLRI